MDKKKEKSEFAGVSDSWIERWRNILYIGAVVIGVFLGFYKPISDLKTQFAVQQERLDVIETNHIVHIQDSMDNLSDKYELLNQQFTELNLKYEKLISILDTTGVTKK